MARLLKGYGSGCSKVGVIEGCVRPGVQRDPAQYAGGEAIFTRASPRMHVLASKSEAACPRAQK